MAYPGQGLGPRGFLTDEEKKNMPKVNGKLVRRILSYLLPYWPQFILVFVTILVSAVLGLLPSIITGRIVDEALVGKNMALLVRLLINDTDFLPNVLYLRSCQVRLGENVNSLMVPSRAIYVQNGRKGVVMSTEGGEYWTGVEVISDDGTTAYVVPDNAGVLYEGMPVRLF